MYWPSCPHATLLTKCSNDNDSPTPQQPAAMLRCLWSAQYYAALIVSSGIWCLAGGGGGRRGWNASKHGVLYPADTLSVNSDRKSLHVLRQTSTNVTPLEACLTFCPFRIETLTNPPVYLPHVRLSAVNSRTAKRVPATIYS